MIDKKRMHFLQLSAVFVLITAISLYNSWNQLAVANSQAAMMNMSMGSMMSSMHGENVTLADLFIQQEQLETAAGQSGHSEHHSEGLQELHYLITATIVILLPIILAGTVFLAVTWLE